MVGFTPALKGGTLSLYQVAGRCRQEESEADRDQQNRKFGVSEHFSTLFARP